MSSSYEGIITRQLRELRERCDKLELALVTLASWEDNKSAQAAYNYVLAILGINKEEFAMPYKPPKEEE